MSVKVDGMINKKSKTHSKKLDARALAEKIKKNALKQQAQEEPAKEENVAENFDTVVDPTAELKFKSFNELKLIESC